MQNRTSPFRLLLWLALLGVAFWAGTAWKNAETGNNTSAYQQDNNTARDTEQVATPLVKGQPADLKPYELETIHLFENAAPSVAFITTTVMQMDFFSRNIMEIPQGTGSAFVWDKKGHIITNFHVIQNADKAQITLADRSTWEAELVGVAPEKDLAVLKINAPEKQLIPITLGSSDNLRVGQLALAIGNPFGLDQTLTTGIISALGREIKSASGVPIRDVIQTDAAINPGNSGGPLLNSSGELIGVNTAIFSPSGAYAGIGFSIPVDEVKWVVPELIKYGKIQRPTLGIEAANSSVSQRLGLEGALVLQVTPGGPAEKAGIRPTMRDRLGRIRLGDVITGIDNEIIKSPADLPLILEKYKPGTQITVTLLREGKQTTLMLTLASN
ncbi:PDZ domain-containing protein [Sphingobacteriales bacterium UPWRP_1]|nr:2-alkenal reductase [Sphingobacteriales bacterium TSM_CSM]PSJ73624.1 PDZ domain-containing protein [Sphingobacteriales bacterium UPWRP_1]